MALTEKKSHLLRCAGMQQVPPKCRYMVLHPRRQYLLVLSSVSLVQLIWGSLFLTNGYPAVHGPVSPVLSVR